MHTSVEIKVVQGERPMAADNKLLGNFILDGIPPAPRGTPQIEVTFDIDADGILKVSAQDKATGKSQHITITASSGLSKDEVEKMVKQAESHAAEDKRRKEEVETRNTADAAAFNAEKLIKEYGDKIPADVKNEVEAKTAEVKKALEGSDLNAMKATTEALNQAIQKIGGAMYGQGGAGPMPDGEGEGGPSTGGSNGKGGDDVVEGEFKEA
jgi:molecular chaperone DnaK